MTNQQSDSGSGAAGSVAPLPRSALTPIFTGLRLALYTLLLGLVAFVVTSAIVVGVETGDWPASYLKLGLAALFTATFAAGALPAVRGRLFLRYTWLILLGVEWLVLGLATPDAAFLAFPLFFLFLHLLPRAWSIGMVALVTLLIIVLLSQNTSWGIGGIIGPIIGALVSVVIASGYEALFREAREREKLIADLVQTRAQLGESERAAGMLAERERLARDIHDTVAQGLSSIQLLLHTVERADPRHPALDSLVLARETAATNLADTRRFIHALTPRALEDGSLAAALRRLGDATARAGGLTV